MSIRDIMLACNYLNHPIRTLWATSKSQFLGIKNDSPLALPAEGLEEHKRRAVWETVNFCPCYLNQQITTWRTVYYGKEAMSLDDFMDYIF